MKQFSNHFVLTRVSLSSQGADAEKPDAKKAGD